MIILDNSEILDQTNLILREMASGASAPLVISDFMGRSFPKLEERANATRLTEMQKAAEKQGLPAPKSLYPYTVRIPKSLEEMIDGDFEPKQVITIDGPIKGPYSNMWFGSTNTGINLRFGYINGDNRKIDNHAMNDSTPHAFLAGATGQGKSVTLNAAIYGCCIEYAPWELTVTLSDAKIVEFKSIALGKPMPHIDTIAATSDYDFLMSMLERKYKEMEDREQVFAKASEYFEVPVKNIKDFRKVSGLSLPRDLLVFDECTAMFQNAEKRVSKLTTILDKFMRLGRNAGFHFILTSQEVSSDLPQSTLDNMQMRCAMGCSDTVSERVLGNKGAVYNMGMHGRLIVNTNSSAKKSEDNVDIRVPFIESELNYIGQITQDAAKQLNYSSSLRFYDEQALLIEDDFKKFVQGFPATPNKLVFGPPSSIIDGPEQVVTFNLTRQNDENICIFGNGELTRRRGIEMLKINITRDSKASNIIMMADPQYGNVCNLQELNPVLMLNERSYDSSIIMRLARETIYKRKVILQGDADAFKDGTTSTEGDNLFYELFERGSKYDTVVNRCRIRYYTSMLTSDEEVCKALGTGASGHGFEYAKKLVKSCIETCHGYGCDNHPVLVGDLPNVWCWVLGLNKILGLGRDQKSSALSGFKKLLQDGTAVCVRFIIATSSMVDLSGIVSDIGIYLIDDLTQQQANSIKAADYYPNNLAKGLMLMYSPIGISDNVHIMKFKKYMFAKER